MPSGPERQCTKYNLQQTLQLNNSIIPNDINFAMLPLVDCGISSSKGILLMGLLYMFHPTSEFTKFV